MTSTHDHDFHAPVEKSQAPPGDRPNSKLAVVSLVFGILTWTVLPVLGALIAIVTGHAGLGQIREEGGRIGGKALARAGMALGYIQVALLAVVLALLGAMLPMYYRESSTAPARQMLTERLAPARAPEPGVKMLNEMGRAEFQLIEEHKLKEEGEAIIACYSAGRSFEESELALLTTRRILYLKEGRITSFDLTEVTRVSDDAETKKAEGLTRYGDVYFIEIQSRRGARMRLKIKPMTEGQTFYNALETAWKATGSGRREPSVEKGEVTQGGIKPAP